MKKHLLFLTILVTMLVSCSNGNLRGREVDSLDGKTYLVIEDDNGGQCGPILIDGQVWEYPINKIGKIKPGIHTIECGGEIEFEIKEGTTFHFDYWGP